MGPGGPPWPPMQHCRPRSPGTARSVVMLMAVILLAIPEPGAGGRALRGEVPDQGLFSKPDPPETHHYGFFDIAKAALNAGSRLFQDRGNPVEDAARRAAKDSETKPRPAAPPPPR